MWRNVCHVVKRFCKSDSLVQKKISLGVDVQALVAAGRQQGGLSLLGVQVVRRRGAEVGGGSGVHQHGSVVVVVGRGRGVSGQVGNGGVVVGV